MKHRFPSPRVRQILEAAKEIRILVIGDVMLDQYICGQVRRISPEAPVPVVEFERETWAPGGAANVARNLTSLGARAEIFGQVGNDAAGEQLREVLAAQRVGCGGLLAEGNRPTSIKTRIIAHQQQVVRVDRESRTPLDDGATQRLLQKVAARLPGARAVILGDYAKGVVTESLLAELKPLCRQRAVWMSYDPKPHNPIDFSGFSLMTPNRKEAFELAHFHDGCRAENPLLDRQLMQTAETLLRRLRPALLLITLGDQGMLLCQAGRPPFHIPTMAREVFDVSGAGDTVIASFTLAIAAGASPAEAAIFSNHAAGVVVGKVGTAAVTPDELLASFEK